MKKWLFLGLCVCFLSGCQKATFETLGDVPHHQVVAPVERTVLLLLPQDAVLAVWENDADTLYACQDYTVHVQILDGGDLDGTIRTVSGFSREGLTVLESRCGDHDRYEWVWTATGDEGDMICRCVLLDDGDFHYAVTVMADATLAGGLMPQWNEMLSSFCLEERE